MPEATAKSYDEVPYASNAFAQSHPDRLCTIARILGVKAAPIETARVLELGCASGGNLIPMAELLPGSSFLGIDLSRRQIDEGQAIISELGFTNIRLEHRGIHHIAAEDGKFDYIICHGVYSWVSAEVQDQILSVCAANLAENGIAYVSYNTYPGWHFRGAVREMLRYHTSRFAETQTQVGQARALLDFLAGAVVDGDGPYGAMIRQEREWLSGKPDFYVLHEHLEQDNIPVYFHEFVNRARAKGLDYLSEAQFSAMGLTGFKPGVEQTLQKLSRDRIHLEQFMDFLRNRTFRQTMLCHAGALKRRVVHPEAMPQTYIASPLRPTGVADGSAVFQGPGAMKLVTRDPLMKAAMEALAERWPEAMHFDEVVNAAWRRMGGQGAAPAEQSHGLASRLVEVYLGGVIEVTGLPTPFAVKAGERPRASMTARWQAHRGRSIVTLRHQTLLVDELSAKILALLDGTRDRGELLRILGSGISAQQLDQTLAVLADSAFLMR